MTRKHQDEGVDAVVVTHNSENDLHDLVRSSETLAAFRRILIVDSASTDSTRDVALAAGLDVIRLPVNRGFAAAANIGALQTRGPVFAVLNPDIAITSAQDVPALLRHFDDAMVGAVAPALVLPDDTVQDSARRVPSPIDLLVRRFAGHRPDQVASGVATDVAWAVGACLFMRRSAYDAVGGFDPRYFLYFEDVDLCVRFAEAGLRVRYDPTVVVAHRHRAASRASLSDPATRHHIASALRFYRKYPEYVLPQRARPTTERSRVVSTVRP